MSADLLPCPFCGGAALIKYSRDGEVLNVRCIRWGVDNCLGAGKNCLTESEARAAWNKRAPDNTAPLRQIISDTAAALGTATIFRPDASLEFMKLLPAEVAATVAALRAKAAEWVEAQQLLDKFKMRLEELEWDSDYGGYRQTNKVFDAFYEVVSGAIPRATTQGAKK